MIRANRTALHDAIKTVLPATKGRHLEILNCVRIDANPDGTSHEGWLTLSATDTDLSVSTECSAWVGEAAALAVPAAPLAGWLAASTADTVELDEDPERRGVVARCGTATIRLQGADMELWPEPPASVSDASQVTLDAGMLDLIERVARYVARDLTRPVITAVRLGGHKDEAGPFAIATDSFRLAVADLNAGEMVGANVHPAIFKVPDPSVDLRLSAARAEVVGKSTTWSSTTVPGMFPPVFELVNRSKEQASERLTVSREGLVEALKRLAVVVPDPHMYKLVRLEPVDGMLRLSRSEGDRASLEDELPCEASDGVVPMAFNADLLRDLAEVALDDDLVLSLPPNPLQPIMAVSGPLTQLLMPVKGR